MTPLKSGLIGALVGAAGSVALIGIGAFVYDELNYSPSTTAGTCDHADYSFSLTVLGQSVLGEIVISEPMNLDARDPNPSWLVRWNGGSSVERLTTQGDFPSATSVSQLGDTDGGASRSVWIKRDDRRDWCKVAGSLG